MTSTSRPRLPYKVKIHDDPTPLASVYSPLQSGFIRVVHILGFAANGLLDCQLRTQHLNEGPYTAISYTWNPETSIWYSRPTQKGKLIRINNSLVLVRDKVADLLCLMHHLGKYAVWIDGLSINQEDLDDKAVQVSQMHSVYTHANMMMAVMSSPTSDTDFLFDRQNWTSECISKKHNRLHKTLLDVLANDYWRRTWILQEIVLGNDIVLCCGERTITLEELFQMANRLEAHDGMVDFLRGTARLSWTILKSDLTTNSSGHNKADGGHFEPRDLTIFTDKGRLEYQNKPFLDVIRTSRRFNRCFEPKDLLYARRGLASDGAALIPQVDYSKERSVEDVYKEFAVRCILTPSPIALRVLTFTSWVLGGDELPSWVPDWRLPDNVWQAAFDNDRNDDSVRDQHTDDNLIRIDWYDGRTDSSRLNDNDLLKLRWSNRAPAVSSDGNGLTVCGRVLMMLTPEHAVAFAAREEGAVSEFFANQFRALNLQKLMYLHPVSSGTPAAGDIICALKDCPAFVFLQRVKDSSAYRLVGKHSHYQYIAVQHCLTNIFLFGREMGDLKRLRWSFQDLEQVNWIPEQSFTII